VRIDALAFETHFVDHLAPVWHELPRELAGEFVVEQATVARARHHGIEGVLANASAIRRAGPRYPLPDPGPGPVALVASYGDIKVGRRMGYRRFAFLEHGAGQSYSGDRRQGRHGSYAGGIDREDVGLFLVPNEDAGSRWRLAYPESRVEVIGCPKLDGLPAREPGPSPVVAISFHWDCHTLPETRSAFGHYHGVLRELAQRFNVIGHGHPRAAVMLERAYRRAGIEWVPDFEDVCRRADVYVCDNSSSLFEFAATGRPVVVLNAPWYRKTVDHGLRFWAAATVGPQVEEPSMLAESVAEALRADSGAHARREAALALVYNHRSGAAERAAGNVAEWLRHLEVIDGEAARRDGQGEDAAWAVV
jgi:hypothetical protein